MEGRLRAKDRPPNYVVKYCHGACSKRQALPDIRWCIPFNGPPEDCWFMFTQPLTSQIISNRDHQQKCNHFQARFGRAAWEVWKSIFKLGDPWIGATLYNYIYIHRYIHVYIYILYIYKFQVTKMNPSSLTWEQLDSNAHEFFPT